MLAPGRPSITAAPLRMSLRSGSGNPPGGLPIEPRMKSITDSGKVSSLARAETAAPSSPCLTIQIAMSPTTFDDGVTLGMSPKSWLTSA